MTAQELKIHELKDANAEQRHLIAEQKLLIESLRVALEESTKQSQELTAQIVNLNEQLDYLKKLLFGSSSEKRAKKPEAEEPTKETLAKKTTKPKSKTKLEDKIKGILTINIIQKQILIKWHTHLCLHRLAPILMLKYA